MLWAFIPIAAVLTLTPGAATALIVRSAAVGGWRSGLRVIVGNEIGVVVWALLSVAGISALVAASEAAFVALKLVGAGVLIWLGVQAWRGRGSLEAGEAAVARVDPAAPPVSARRAGAQRRALRDGLITALANPKLAVFYVALFPQFIGRRDAGLSRTLVMAAIIIVLDVVWYTTLAVAVSRARRAFDRTRLARRLEQISGSILIALGIRVAVQPR